MSSDINVQTFSGKVNINNNLLVGSGHLFVDTQNNLVGLRTSDPQAGLHVESNTYVRDDFRVGSGIVMNETTGQITAGSFVGDGSGITSVNSDSGSWVNGVSSNVHLATIGDSVGIGVVEPLYKLDVAGDINITTGSTLRINGTPAVFSNWTVSGSNIYRSTGNVGIGTTTMTEKLTVNGNLDFTPAYGGDTTNCSGMIIFNKPIAESIDTSTNIDSIYFNDSTNTYHFTQDTTKYATGNAGIQCGSVTATTFTGSLSTSVTPGSYLTGDAYNGSTARTFAVDATSANTASKIVARDSSGHIYGSYIFGGYMNMSHSASARNSDTVFYSSTDDYIRKTTAAGMRSSLGLANSATITATSANTANQICQRNGSGDIFCRLFRSDYQNQTDCGAGIAFRNSTSDNYIRFCTTMSAVRSRIGCAATGGSTAQNFSSKECYVQGWVRTNGNSGHYWEGSSNGNGWHIYPKNRADMYMRTGSGNGGLAFCIANATVRGYIHCTTSNEIGFLNSGRGWSLRMDNSNNCQVYGRMYASGSVSETMTARYYNVSGGNASYTTTRAISVYALQMMRCSEMQVTSDRRIKTDIVDVDDGSALELLRKIQPKTYGYVDTLEKGTKHVYGFIAQEIKELIPEAVDVGEGDLPNIYKYATIDIQANSITIKDFDTSTLNQTDSIIYIDQDDKRKTLKIKSIINSTQLEIEEDLEKVVETFKTSKKEEYIFTGEIFIWGQKVQDFHHLKKSAIYTVATAALQEVDRQLQAEKTENEITRLKLANAESRISILEQSISSILSKLNV